MAVPVALAVPNALCAHHQEFSSEFGTHDLSVRSLIHYSNISGIAENSQAPRRTGVQRLWSIRFTLALLLRSIKVTLPTVFLYLYTTDFVTPYLSIGGAAFYMIINLSAGGTSGWFPDEVGDKPWFDTSSSKFTTRSSLA